MKAPYFLLLIPTALSALAYFLWSDVEWVTTFSSNLGAGFLGSFLTVLLVERALERHKEQEVRRIRNVGLGQLRAPLGQHLTLLAEWYKAALPASVPLPSTFEHFFGDDFYEHVRRLDFSRAAPTWPTSPPLDWFQHSGQELERFRRQLERVIDKYVASLEPTLIELVEGLANSDFMNVFTTLARLNLPQLDRAEGSFYRYSMLESPLLEKYLRNHITLVLRFLHYFETNSRSDFSIEPLAFSWREDVHPHFGSARAGDVTVSPWPLREVTETTSARPQPDNHT